MREWAGPEDICVERENLQYNRIIVLMDMVIKWIKPIGGGKSPREGFQVFVEQVLRTEIYQAGRGAGTQEKAE